MLIRNSNKKWSIRVSESKILIIMMLYLLRKSTTAVVNRRFAVCSCLQYCNECTASDRRINDGVGVGLGVQPILPLYTLLSM